MIRRLARAVLVLAAVAAAADDESPFVGEWRGTSTCTIKESACHDEVNVYHVTRQPGKAGYLSVSADKIVDGRNVNMGAMEFRYEPDSRTIVSENPRGAWRFKVAGDRMEGGLTLADQREFRRVSLHREK